jgi:hypothetical protein
LAKYKLGKGAISVFVSGDARAQKPNALPFSAGATFSSTVNATFLDFLRFTFPPGVDKVKANASFNVSANLVTGGEGASGESGIPNDEVGYSATAYLDVRGTGVPAGPHTGTSGGLFTYYAYQQRNLPPGASAERLIDQPLTTSSIPVVIEATRSDVFVQWTMTASVRGSVEALDHWNFAEGTAYAIGDASHTLRWGGITSVVDADTGLPVTEWTLTSESGFDWTRPAVVPEPAVPALALVALGGLAGYRRLNAEDANRATLTR